MTDQPPDARPPTPPDPVPEDVPRTPPGAPSQGAGDRQRFTDRVWSFQALVVVALVSLLLGGLAGAGLANVADRDEDRYGPGRRHFDGAAQVTSTPAPEPRATSTG